MIFSNQSSSALAIDMIEAQIAWSRWLSAGY